MDSADEVSFSLYYDDGANGIHRRRNREELSTLTFMSTTTMMVIRCFRIFDLTPTIQMGRLPALVLRV